MQIPSNIIDLAKRDVRMYGLPDGSVKEEDKHPEVQSFINQAWLEIEKSGEAFKDKRAALEKMLQQIYPSEHNGNPSLKQNSALRKFFSEQGLE